MTAKSEDKATKAKKVKGGNKPAKPLTATDLCALALPPPPGKFRARGHLWVFGGRIFIGAADRVFSAAPDDRSWAIAFEPEKRTLTEAAAEYAQALGMVQDGPAAAGMGVQLPGAFSFGPFAAFKGDSDRHPCLYCAMSSVFGGGILRSADGKTLKLIGMPGLGDPTRVSFGSLLAAEGWLLTAAAPLIADQSPRSADKRSEPVMILGSQDPFSGAFEYVAEPGFGAGVRGGVTAMASAHGKIYAAIRDADRGFELWRASPANKLPWEWDKVLDRGAHAFSQASTVSQMCEFKGDLYLATGISESGFGKDYAGPAAAQLLRVRADGGWDLVVGQPRFSPDGLKVPLSGIGPGFGDGYHTLVTSLGTYSGVLYAGTRNSESEYRIRRAKEGDTPKMAGGAALWASTDGENWGCVFSEGKGNPALTAVRSIWAGDEGFHAAMAINPQVLAHDVGMGETGPASDEIEIWRNSKPGG